MTYLVRSLELILKHFRGPRLLALRRGARPFLTTGTFNLFVKDRIRTPPERHGSVENESHPKAAFTCPRKLPVTDCSATRGKPFENIAAGHALSTQTAVPVDSFGTSRGARRKAELQVQTANHAPAEIGIVQSTRADAGVFKPLKDHFWRFLRRTLETLRESLVPESKP